MRLARFETLETLSVESRTWISRAVCSIKLYCLFSPTLPLSNIKWTASKTVALLGLSSDSVGWLDRLELNAGHRWQGSNTFNGINTVHKNAIPRSGEVRGWWSGVWGTGYLLFLEREDNGIYKMVSGRITLQGRSHLSLTALIKGRSRTLSTIAHLNDNSHYISFVQT